MNKLKTTHNGGMGLELDDFRFMDNGYRDAFKGILSAFKVPLHHAIILSGCVRSVANNQVTVSEGYVSLAGEVMYMPTQSYPLGGYEYIVPNITYANTGDEAFQDGNIHSTYEVRQAHIQVSANQIPTMPHIFQMLTIYDVIQSRLPQIGINTIESAKQSTETQRGHIILATQAETNNGADDSKAITPKKLWNNPLIPKIYHKSRVYLGTMIGSDLFTINMPNIGTTNYLVLGTLRWYSSSFNSGQAWSALANSTFLVWSLGSQETDSFSIVVKDIRPTPTTAKVFFDYVLIKH